MVCWGTLGRLPNPNLLRWPRDAGPQLHRITRLQCRSAASAVPAVISVASPQEAAAAAPAAAPTHSKGKRRRLDDVCLELRPADARNVIQSWIVQGKVQVDGRVVTKAGTPVQPDAAVQINAVVPKFVCRAGLKLEAALDAFGVDVRNVVALDSGLSTGGFADCLLQRGALRVYGVDVGFGQVAERVRTDERLVVMERTNLRHLRSEHLPERPALATLDLSFISLLKVLPAIADVLAPASQLILLVKPQFEAARSQVSPGGVVKDPAVHQQVIEKVTAGAAELGFVLQGVIESPIRGATSGNAEFLAHFVRVEASCSEQLASAVPEANARTSEHSQ